MNRIFCLLLILTFFNPVLCVTPQQQDKYKVNPTPDPTSKTEIYIPVDLEDSLRELKKMLHPDLLKEIKEAPEQNTAGYHMSLGLWMRNNWRLWAGSRLAKHFNGIGIFHPDDMSGIILVSLWRDLNLKPIKLTEQVAFYQKFWQVNAEPKGKKCPHDGSLIEVYMSFGESEADQPRAIHIGRCKKRRHLWAYEYGKGWYKPDAALLKRINESH